MACCEAAKCRTGAAGGSLGIRIFFWRVVVRPRGSARHDRSDDPTIRVADRLRQNRPAVVADFRPDGRRKDTTNLRSIAQSRTEPASRFRRARIFLVAHRRCRRWATRKILFLGRPDAGTAPSDGPALRGARSGPKPDGCGRARVPARSRRSRLRPGLGWFRRPVGRQRSLAIQHGVTVSRGISVQLSPFCRRVRREIAVPFANLAPVPTAMVTGR
jgi:hypothetical protein